MDSASELGIKNSEAGGGVEEGGSGMRGRRVLEMGENVVGDGEGCGLGRERGIGPEAVESLGG